MDNKDNSNNHDKAKRRTILIIIIIIIILSLITSCSCTAKFWGRIGDLFNNSKEYTIDKDTKDLPIVKNKDLKFDIDDLEMSLSEEGIISFSYKNISPDKFTCITSDASIATCYVKDNHVVINGKKTGDITITLEAITNGKRYQATSKVTITDSNRYIELSSTSGTINLYYFNTKTLVYNLINLSGDIKVTIDDASIVSATAKDGLLTITGLKVGSTTITLSITYNGKEYKATYKINVIRSINSKNSDSTLKSLTANKGEINFNSHTKKYYLEVDTPSITLDAIPNNNKSKVTYEFNGKSVNSLKDLELKEGENKVKITVTAEDNSTTTYEVTINYSKKSSNNNLKNLTLNGSSISDFNKDNLDYSVKIPYNQDTFTLNGIKEDNNSKVKYKYKNKTYDNCNDIPIKPGETITVDVIVESEDGKTKTYTVDVYRSIRTIKFNKSKYRIHINNTYNIGFTVYEDGEEITDYDLKDINFNGFTISKVAKGIIKVNSNTENTYKLTISYATSSDTTTLEFFDEDYYLNGSKETYLDVTSKNNDKDIVVYNNFFNGEVTMEEIPNGVRIRDKNNPDIYIDIEYDKDNLTILDAYGSSPLVLGFKATKSGDYKLKFSGNAGNLKVKGYETTIHVTVKYILTLDANGGYFTENTNKYEFTLKENESFDLTNYLNAYLNKASEEGKCVYYLFKEYNTKKDGKGVSYNNENKTIKITKDTTLYAIYDETSYETEIEEKTSLYLVDVNLFHNEEYFQEYGKDKIIYPGATGSYTMELNNTSGKDLTLTAISLEEETICVDTGCINMGYVIKDGNNTYYYGKSGDKKDNTIYEILPDHDNENIIPIDNILIPNNNSTPVSITLNWRWIDNDDVTDTKIGNYVAQKEIDETINDLYKLTVRLDFTSLKTECKLESVTS